MDIFEQFCCNLQDYKNWHDDGRVLGSESYYKFYGLNPDFRISYEMDKNSGEDGKVYPEDLKLFNFTDSEINKVSGVCLNSEYYLFRLWYKDLNVITLMGCSLDNHKMYAIFPDKKGYNLSTSKNALSYYLSCLLGNGNPAMDRHNTPINVPTY